MKQWILLLSGGYLIVATLSTANSLPMLEVFKFGRVLISVAIIALGVLGLGITSRVIGSTSKALLGFVAFYWLAALWSDLPEWGLIHKGFLMCSVSAGVVFIYSQGSRAAFDKSMRFLITFIGLTAVALSYIHTQGSGAEATHARVATLGMNPNWIGGSAGVLLVLALYCALYETRMQFRWIAIGTSLLLGLVVMSSGSRGAFVAAACGGLLIALPLTKRPAKLLAFGGCAFLVAYFALEILELGGAQRLVSEFDKDTRGASLKGSLRLFEESPIIGHGWIHHGTRSSSLHNLYLQTLAETGIIGAIFLAVVGVSVAVRAQRTIRLLGNNRHNAPIAWLGIALVGVTMSHGIGESSTLLGTTVNSFLLGAGFALIDRVYDAALAIQPVRNMKRIPSRQAAYSTA